VIGKKDERREGEGRGDLRGRAALSLFWLTRGEEAVDEVDRIELVLEDDLVQRVVLDPVGLARLYPLHMFSLKGAGGRGGRRDYEGG
jgi:hypothetical protein